jgi:hypothetical protein
VNVFNCAAVEKLIVSQRVAVYSGQVNCGN